MSTPARTETGIDRREDEERRRARRRAGAPRTRRSMPWEPAAAIRPIDSTSRPPMSRIATGRRVAAEQSAMTISPEAEDASPASRRRTAPGAERPSIVNVEAPRRAGGAGVSARPAAGPGTAGLAGRAAGPVGPRRRPGRTAGRTSSTLGQRILRGRRDRSRRGRAARCADRRRQRGRRGRRCRRGGGGRDGDPAGGVTAARQRLDRGGRRPRVARSPCRTRRTATSPSRPAGCSSGRPGSAGSGRSGR